MDLSVIVPLYNEEENVAALHAEIVVCGWRQEPRDALSRRLPSVVANWLIGALTGTRVHDNGCTLKAYRSEVVKRAGLYGEMHRFMAPLLALSGSRVTEVVVNHRARRAGVSKYGMSRIWKVLLDLLAVKMLIGSVTRPARWFGLLSLPFLAGAAAALAASVWFHFTLPATPAGGLPLVFPAITVLFAFAFFHLLVVGMVGELVVKLGDFKESESVLAAVEAPPPGLRLAPGSAP